MPRLLIFSPRFLAAMMPVIVSAITKPTASQKNGATGTINQSSEPIAPPSRDSSVVNNFTIIRFIVGGQLVNNSFKMKNFENINNHNNYTYRNKLNNFKTIDKIKDINLCKKYGVSLTSIQDLK